MQKIIKITKYNKKYSKIFNFSKFSDIEYKDNADFNAAKNIKNRVLVTVLRETLLKQLDNGAFEPKKQEG